MSSIYSKKCLLPYFQNRVAEVKENLAQVKKLCNVEGVFYVESALNPSDLSTRAMATINELGPDSVHQTGPFFSLPRSEWPITQSCSSKDIPVNEIKIRNKLAVTAATRATFCFSSVYPTNSWSVLEGILSYSISLVKVKRILARYIRGVSSSFRKSGSLVIDNPEAYELIACEPTRDELQRAEKLILLHGIPQTKEALNAGKLDSLLPSREGRLIVTRGRLGEKSLELLLGVKSLPILMPETIVANLFMMFAHSGELGLVHRSAVTILARSRVLVWIVRGRIG